MSLCGSISDFKLAAGRFLILGVTFSSSYFTTTEGAGVSFKTIFGFDF